MSKPRKNQGPKGKPAPRQKLPPRKFREQDPADELPYGNEDENEPAPQPLIVKKLPLPLAQFPSPWVWFFDEAVPQHVKMNYSPRESWKNKPFEKTDVSFFSKGVRELSDLFTESRVQNMPAYFRHPKYRSSYLLYFLCLQASKFLSLYQLHPDAIRAALDHAKANEGVLRIADLGSGPGTASLAFLLHILDSSKELPGAFPTSIEFDWYDLDRSVLADGVALVEVLSSHFPKLRGKVKVKTYASPWSDVVRKSREKESKPYSLILLGHVLNEKPSHNGPSAPEIPPSWPELLEIAQGAGILVVEPASSRTSQNLSRLRDQLLETSLIPKTPRSFWGPCLHAERCPLASGRDWCHFSVPVQIPGKWFKEFSKTLGSERNWLKFSYLWISSPTHPAPEPGFALRRVVSDPFYDKNSPEGRGETVLLCEPQRVYRLTQPVSSQLLRGDLISLRKPGLDKPIS
jgi:hypothetical protein